MVQSEIKLADNRTDSPALWAVRYDAVEHELQESTTEINSAVQNAYHQWFHIDHNKLLLMLVRVLWRIETTQ